LELEGNVALPTHWKYIRKAEVEFHSFLTHCGQVTQICVFTLQLWRTG